MWALAHLFTEREEATQNAKQVGMNHSTKIFTNCQRSMQAGTTAQNSWDAKTQEECSHPLAIFFSGAHEKDWRQRVSLSESLEKEVGERPLSSVEQKHHATHGERGNKPGYPRAEVRTTEAKVVYMKKLSSCLENQCDGRPSSSHPGHTMTEVGSYELGWWDGK